MPAPAANPSTDRALPSLAFELATLLRADGHLCNVLTHISSGDWRAVEQAIVTILTPRAQPMKLSKLARNLLALLCDDLGITGRSMRPFVFQAIGRIAGEAEMKRLEARIRRLRRRVCADPLAGLAAAPRPAPGLVRAAQPIRVNLLPFIAASPRSANGVHP